MDSTQRTIYHIRVHGRLDDKWADWFSGFAMTTRESGETLLSGTVSGQAELFGILAKINNLGLPLLMVARIDCPNRDANFEGWSSCQECAAQGKLPACFRERQDKERKEQNNE